MVKDLKGLYSNTRGVVHLQQHHAAIADEREN
jgi:hypothetical protein